MSTYQQCMTTFMKGPKDVGGVSAMCVGAKICTGKAKDQPEAVEICRQNPVAITKKGFTKGARCMTSIDTVVDCLMERMNWQASDFRGELKKQASECFCGHKATKKAKAMEALAAIPEDALQALASIHGLWAPQPKGEAIQNEH